MRKSKFLLKVLLSVFLLMSLVVSGCSKSDDAASSTSSYTISGNVTGASNVTVTLSGTSSGSTTVASSGGTYSFTVSNGTYQVTPSATGYVFTPPSASITVNGSNMTQDFTAAAGTSFTVSGVVTGAANVTMNISGDATGSFVTGASGSTYTSAGLAAGNYVITPYLSGYSFTPANISIPLSANYTGANFTAAAANYTQADLTGTWHIFMITAGHENRATATINSSGNATITDCYQDGTSGTCPADISWTINESNGVISEIGANADTNAHLTMAANKTFVAGTADNTKLIIAMKEKPGTTYANSDIRGKNFAYHQLTSASTSSFWSYGNGSTDSSTGEVTLSSATKSGGGGTTGDTGSAVSVDPTTGIVTMSGTGMSGFSGFLSADHRTIVGVWMDSGSDPSMLIIQLNDGQSSSTSGANGTWFDHMLTVGSGTDIPFWAHMSMAISSGTMTFGSDWSSSSGASGPGSGNTEIISIASSGAATLSGSSTAETTFNGQVSYDGTFMVATQTYDTGAYSLMVVTKVNGSN